MSFTTSHNPRPHTERLKQKQLSAPTSSQPESNALANPRVAASGFSICHPLIGKSSEIRRFPWASVFEEACGKVLHCDLTRTVGRSLHSPPRPRDPGGTTERSKSAHTSASATGHAATELSFLDMLARANLDKDPFVHHTIQEARASPAFSVNCSAFSAPLWFSTMRSYWLPKAHKGVPSSRMTYSSPFGTRIRSKAA